MTMASRIGAGLCGLLLFVQGVQWMFAPARAAANIEMPLLEGVARSSQIGDTGAFFLGAATMAFIGVFRIEHRWLQAAALLVAFAAILRATAWALHDAPLALQFIVPELVLFAVLAGASVALRRGA